MSIKAYNELLYKWRWLVVFISIAFIALASFGAKYITFSSDYQVFFDESNEQMAAFELLQNTYSKSDNVLIALLPKDGEVFNESTLQAVGKLTELSWQLPYSSRVDSLTNYQHTFAIEDDLIVENLIPDTGNISQEIIQRAKDIALNEPLIKKRLISPQGDVTAVNITVQMPDGNESAVREVMVSAREIVKQMQQEYPDITFALTGLVPLSNAFAESAERDITTLIPLMFVLIIITLAVLLKSIAATFTVVMIILFSIVASMGIFGWTGHVLSPPTTAIPTIIMTVAVADSVHLLLSFFIGLRSGLDKKAAMEQSLHLNMKAVFITSFTTVVGFLSMNFSEVPPIRETGNTVAIGVTIAYFLSVVFLPSLMFIFPLKAKVNESKRITFMEKYAEFLIRHKNAMLVGTLIISAGFIALIPYNKINDEFIKYFHTSTQFRQDTDLVSDRLSGIYTIEFSLESEGSNGITDPAFIQDVANFSDWLNQQPGVEHVYTFSDVFKRLNKNMHGDNADFYAIPDNKELASQYLLLYEMSLPYGLDLNDQINIDKSSVRVVATLKNIPSMETLALERAANIWLDENAHFKAHFDASPNIMFSHIGARNVKSIIEGSLVALVIISLVMIIALRSLKLGLISLAPNLLPAGIAFGIWALINGNLGMSIISAIGMTLGIVVDDTVHFLVKYRVARVEKGLSPEDSIRYAFSNVGFALFVTTFVLVSGFLVLASSTFLMNAQQGIFTAITIGVALILDFVFLPTLLLFFEERKNEKTA